MKKIGITFAIAALLLSGVSSVFVTSNDTSAASCVNTKLRYGSNNNCVKYAQTLANYTYSLASKALGGKRTLVVDGKFGSKTKSAIVNIQANSYVRKTNTSPKIYLSKDGVVGPQTWEILCSYGGYNGGASTTAASRAGCGSLSTYKSSGIY